MKFTVKDERPGLCYSCDEAHAFEYEDGKSHVYCTAVYSHVYRISGVVTKCSSYRERGSLSKHDAEQIAWILTTTKGGKIGFTPPKKENT